MWTVTGGTQSRPSIGPSLQPCELRVAARTQEPKAEPLMPTSVPHDRPVDAGIKAVWVNMWIFCEESSDKIWQGVLCPLVFYG